MNTKEAIEKLNHGSKAFLTDSILDMNILELIALLKRGEKYETMWGELRNKMNNLNTKEMLHVNGEDCRDEINRLQHKHFPRE